MIDRIADWPLHARVWALTNHLTQGDLDKFDIQYDPNSDRVYLPQYSVVSMAAGPSYLEGYQLRATRKNHTPKYYTVQRPDKQGHTRIVGSDEDSVILVEDLISGITLSKYTECSIHVNYGVKCDPTVMYRLAHRYKRVAVWLDNDSSHVIKQAKTMARTIQLYSPACKVGIVEGASDPKHYDADEIAKWLGDTWIT